MKNLGLLRFLLVLSGIFASLSLFSATMMATMLPTLDRLYQANADNFPGEIMAMWNRMAAIPRPFYAAQVVLYAVELTGVVLMWRLRRSGFHCYALSCLLLLLLPLLFLGRGNLATGDLMFTLLFLALYYFLLRGNGVFSSSFDDNSDSPGDNNEDTSDYNR